MQRHLNSNLIFCLIQHLTSFLMAGNDNGLLTHASATRSNIAARSMEIQLQMGADPTIYPRFRNVFKQKRVYS